MAASEGIAALSRAYRAGQTTPVDVVQAALARIAARDPVLNAFADPMAAQAMAQAEAMTAAQAAGQAAGPLFGIPVAVKDLIEVAGAPTGYGTMAVPPRVAARDAALVARLRAAGAIIMGKTNLLEYAYGVAHPAIGQTNNPHDPTRTAGGSSGGSAAAVADGIVPLAVGTDTGGSIRIPAAYCGIVGMKPTFGLVPLDGVFPLSWSLDHAGPLARSVEDAAALLAVLADRPIVLADAGLDGLRIGIVRRHVSSTPLGRDVTRLFEAAMARLEAAGARLVEVDHPMLAEANARLISILMPEASVIHAELFAQNPDGYAPGTRQQIVAGFDIPATEHVRALRFQRAFRDAVEGMFATCDVLAAPAVPFVAPIEDPEIAEGEDSEMLASGFANVSGHPALSLPCGMAGQLPAGLQLVGPFGDDAGLLSVARTIESALQAS
ncbi:MAG: amidase [Limimaricola sp.]|uniref:amidase n=1 Tax=Limimaricola sp. TaxID=2211665 RepID=UPI001E0FFE95|nr:amidase [Limimaricola sp.]MBI1417037.1 amidase [Limimaricola sp.]